MSSATVIANAIVRFRLNVARSAPGLCWLWQRSRDKDGYGHATFCGQAVRAHRVAYTLDVGDIPEGFSVLHRCDNPPCCNPAHVFLGTQKDNRDDAMTKGREPQGESRWNARLTVITVKEIRRRRLMGDTYASLARDFRVDLSTIQAACSRRNWKSVA